MIRCRRAYDGTVKELGTLIQDKGKYLVWLIDPTGFAEGHKNVLYETHLSLESVRGSGWELEPEEGLHE